MTGKKYASKESKPGMEHMHAKYIICSFYTDILADDTKSPGYLDSTEGDRRPAAYVVPTATWQERNLQRTVDPIEPHLSGQYRAKWVREHVRLIKLKSNLGLSSSEILEDYLVRVPYPISSASTGELVRKPGRYISQAAVPDGVTDDDLARYKLINRKISLEERKNLALARYGDRGAPLSIRGEQFPADGDHWIGSA